MNVSEIGAAGSAHVDATGKILTARVLSELPAYKTQAAKAPLMDSSPVAKEDEEIAKEKRAAKNRQRKENKRALGEGDVRAVLA